MTYLVYFEQINQQMYEVEAANLNEARNVARSYWKVDNGPIVISVEAVAGNQEVEARP